MRDDPETSSTLLHRLKSCADEDAWEEFTRLYGPLLQRWVRHSGIPASDVQDLVQVTTLAVFRALPKLDYRRGYKGGFRGYLLQCVRSKVADYWRAKKRRPIHTRLWDNTESSENDPQAEVWDREYTEYFLQQTFDAVRPKVPTETWRLFLLYVKKEKTTEELAGEFGISTQAVHLRVWRVIEKLREHIQRIDPDLWPEF